MHEQLVTGTARGRRLRPAGDAGKGCVGTRASTFTPSGRSPTRPTVSPVDRDATSVPVRRVGHSEWELSGDCCSVAIHPGARTIGAASHRRPCRAGPGARISARHSSPRCSRHRTRLRRQCYIGDGLGYGGQVVCLLEPGNDGLTQLGSVFHAARNYEQWLVHAVDMAVAPPSLATAGKVISPRRPPAQLRTFGRSARGARRGAGDIVALRGCASISPHCGLGACLPRVRFSSRSMIMLRHPADRSRGPREPRRTGSMRRAGKGTVCT